MDAPHPNCGENSLFHFHNTIHVATNNFQVSFQTVENEGNTLKSQCSFILMNFHWSSPKTDYRNGYTISKFPKKRVTCIVFPSLLIEWKVVFNFFMATWIMSFHNWNGMFQHNLDVAFPFLQTVFALVEWKFIFKKQFHCYSLIFHIIDS